MGYYVKESISVSKSEPVNRCKATGKKRVILKLRVTDIQFSGCLNCSNRYSVSFTTKQRQSLPVEGWADRGPETYWENETYENKATAVHRSVEGGDRVPV